MKKEEGAPRDILIVPAIMVGAGGLGFVALEVLLRTLWKELPWWDVRAVAVAVGLIPACMLTDACFKQKHTYNANIYEKNPGCLVPAWLFFWSVMTVFTSIALGAPAAGFTYCLIRAIRREAWFYAPIMITLGLGALAVSVSALSRGLLLWATRRHVQEMATSTVRAAAAGLVELRGVARPIDVSNAMIFGQTPSSTLGARPFYLEDATGRVRVEPPAVDPGDDPRFSLKVHPTYGLRSLEPGDPILVVGAIQEDPAKPGERVLGPWKPSSAPFGTSLLSRPEIFLLCGGDEDAAKRRLARTRLGWLCLGAALIAGSLLTVAIATAALLKYEALATLMLAR